VFGRSRHIYSCKRLIIKSADLYQVVSAHLLIWQLERCNLCVIIYNSVSQPIKGIELLSSSAVILFCGKEKGQCLRAPILKPLTV